MTEGEKYYVALLEDLIADIDETGICNFCDCEEFNDLRCCWIERSWQAVLKWRNNNLGGQYNRMTNRINQEDKFLGYP